MVSDNRCTTNMNNSCCNDITMQCQKCQRPRQGLITTTRTSHISTDANSMMIYQQQERSRCNNNNNSKSYFLPIIVLSIIILMNPLICYPTMFVTSFQIQSLSSNSLSLSCRKQSKVSSIVNVVRQRQQQRELRSSRIDVSILDKPVIPLHKLLNNNDTPMTPIVSFVSLVQDCIQSLLVRSKTTILKSTTTIFVSFFIVVVFWKLIRKFILPTTTSILQSILQSTFTFSDTNDLPIPMKFDLYDSYTATTTIGSVDKDSDTEGTTGSYINNDDKYGWGYGTIKSIKSYSDLTNICTIQLPKRNMYIPTTIGQPITICTMIEKNDNHDSINNDNNENDNNNLFNNYNDIITTCTDVYPFNLYSTTNIPKGLVSFLIPQQYSEDNDNDEDNNRYNLQNTIHVGDTVALRPSSNGSKLVVVERIQHDEKPIVVSLVKQPLQQQHNHHHLPATILLKEATKIVYVVIGVAGIAPVIDQISFLLSENGNHDDDDEEEEQLLEVSSSTSSLSSTMQKQQQITILWICNNDDEFDNSITDHLEELYTMYPTNLSVSCIVDDTITDCNNTDNNNNNNFLESYRNNYDIQESMEQQMYENHDHNFHTTPTPSTANNEIDYSSLAIISVASDYYNPQKTSTIINTATTFLQQDRQFPLECIITM